MAKIAFVQSYPYDAFFGGDGAYIVAVGLSLLQSGHSVYGFVSDTTRGRSNPLYRSLYPIETFTDWQARELRRIGRRTFIPGAAAGVRQVTKAILRRAKLGPQVSPLDDVGEASAEAEWVVDKVAQCGADLVLLCFDAVYLAEKLRGAGVKVIALPGSPILGREVQANRSEPDHADAKGAAPFAARLAAALRAAHCVGLASEDDAVYVRASLGLDNCFFVGMGFDDHTIPRISDQPTALFVGNATTPNREGLQWLLKSVWPRVRAERADARLRIVGKVAETAEKSDCDGSIDCVGPLPSLQSEYERAQVVLAPLLSGTTGVKVKVAEAMSYGRPLVTTTVGVDPANLSQLGSAAIVTDEPERFASAICRFFSDGPFREEKTLGARHAFKECFSHLASHAELGSWVRKLEKA
jgi:glycosyltransferase involved in cell wall biosynthesis